MQGPVLCCPLSHITKNGSSEKAVFPDGYHCHTQTVQRLEGIVTKNCHDTYGDMTLLSTTWTALLWDPHTVTCDTMVNTFILVAGTVLALTGTKILACLF